MLVRSIQDALVVTDEYADRTRISLCNRSLERRRKSTLDKRHDESVDFRLPLFRRNVAKRAVDKHRPRPQWEVASAFVKTVGERKSFMIALRTELNVSRGFLRFRRCPMSPGVSSTGALHP